MITFCLLQYVAYHEKLLIAGNHPLYHSDDGCGLLSPGRALHTELFIRALLLVQQVWPKDGGQVD